MAELDVEETTGASVVRGGAWTLASRVIPQLQVVALSIAAARFLAPSAMGRQSFIAFVAASVVLFATAGLPAGLSRFVAELTGAHLGGIARSMFWWTWRIMALSAVLGAVGLGLAALGGATPQAAWVLAAIGCALAIMQTVPSALLSGAQRWREATLAGMVTGVLGVPAAIAVLALGGGITGFFAVETATIAVNLAWVGLLGRRVLIGLAPRAPVPAAYRTRFAQFAGATTLFTAIEFVVWRRSEFVFLATYSTNVQIALYSIAFAASAALIGLPEAITKVMTPAVAALAGAGEMERIRGGYWRALRIMLIITPMLTALAAALGPLTIDLVYGRGYHGVNPVFLLLVAPLPILPLLGVTQAVLFALGRLRFLIFVGLAATAVNIGLDWLLIPPFEAVGAGIANASAQVAAGLPGLIYAGRMFGPTAIGVRDWLPSVATAAVTGVAAFAVAETVDGVAGLVAGSVTALVVGWSAAAILRPVSARDAAWMAQLGGGGTGRLAAFVARRFGQLPSQSA